VVHIRLETLDRGEGPQPFQAAFDTGLRRFANETSPFNARADIGSLDELREHAKDSATGIFEFWDASPNPVVKSGLESSWLTVGP
jgi:hypothetical protein